MRTMRTRLMFLSAVATAAVMATGGLEARAASDEDLTVEIDENDFTARLRRGRVILNIPYNCSPPCKSVFTATLKTIRGRIVARRSKRFPVVKEGATPGTEGPLRVELPHRAGRKGAELLVLHYRQKAGKKRERGTVALALILQAPRILVLGQKSLIAGTPAALRVVVQDQRTRKPMAGVSVTATLSAKGVPAQTHVGRTGASGTFRPVFKVKPGMVGKKARLTVTARTPTDVRQVTADLKVGRKVKVLLTTDKPIYQPGQVIHLRSLSLQSPAGGAVAKAPMTFKIYDGRRNKVFQKSVNTDRFGIAHSRFRLADRVNQGRYRITAELGLPGGERQKSVKTVRVFKYRLPKFKIRTVFKRRYYRPGETVTGEAYVWYVFKKPVVGGKVLVEAAKEDVGLTWFARAKGRTNRWGAFRFRFKLPAHFVGRPLLQGRARALVKVTVVEPGGERRTARAEVPVVKYPVRIAMIPESGGLAFGIPQKVHVLTTLPDGSPTSARVTVTAFPARTPSKSRTMKLSTDAQGLGHFTFKPEARRVRFTMNARDTHGRNGHAVLKMYCGRSVDAVLVRPKKSLYDVGDRMDLEVMATTRSGYAYVDLIRAGQTLSTHELRLTRGRGRLSLPLSTDASGVLLVSAYVFNKKGEAVRDTRPVYVRQAGGLKIQVKTDKKSYEPGQKASLMFQVTNARGHPVLAALGVLIIDSAVYALTEMQPGLARAFFRLEQDLLRPRVHVHMFAPAMLIFPEPRPVARTRQARAAEVLMSAASPGYRYSLKVDGHEQYLKRVGARAARMARPVIKTIARRIASAVRRYMRRHCCWSTPSDEEDLIEAHQLRKRHLIDPWGEKVDVEIEDIGYRGASITVSSNGMDEDSSTGDEISYKTYTRFTCRRCPRRPMKFSRRMGALTMNGGGGGGGGSAPRPRAARLGRSGFLKTPPRPRPTAGTKAAPAGKPVRVRKYFPEALYVNPALITDRRGRVRVPLKMADSITTWKLSAMASTVDGQLGSTAASIRVFTRFFADVSLPPELTRGDRITVPVALHNYQPTAETVRVTLKRAPWFKVVGGGHEKTVTMRPRSVASVKFSIRAVKVGTHRITAVARGARVSDAVERVITVRPDGDRADFSQAGVLDKPAAHVVRIPARAIDGSPYLAVQVAPGALAAAVDGLESMLRMPYGCFEQTSSATYPNILILNYLKNSRHASPALAMRARRMIATGYQRLISFETPGGGFSLFGHPPADKALTAYGLHEFVDMARVYPVDRRLIQRTRRYLVRKQRSAGHWKPTPSYFMDEDSAGDRIRVTAYTAWALLRAGQRGGPIRRAFAYIRRRMHKVKDPYTLALIAAMAAEKRKRHTLVRRALKKLDTLKVSRPGETHWRLGDGQTITHSGGRSADVETTALVTWVLLKTGQRLSDARRALKYLVTAKSPRGGWGSTQATVLTLKALLAEHAARRGKSPSGPVVVKLDGNEVGRLNLRANAAGVLHSLNLSRHLRPGRNARLQVQFLGKGTPLYQIIGSYHLPYGWIKRPRSRRAKMDLKVSYDKTRLTTRDTVKVTVTLTNPTRLAAIMPMIDLGKPAGFDPVTDDLTKLVESRKISRFEVLARQIVIYLNRLNPRRTLTFTYRLRARNPLRVTAPPSDAYEYYTSEKRTRASAAVLTVR